MRRTHLLSGLVLLLSIALISIATASAQQPTVQKTPFAFTEVDVSLLEQVELLDQKFQKDGLVYNDPALEEYLNQVGNSVLPEGGPPERVQWRFRSLRDPMANAFALPNGSIYVNTGLLALLESEEQLASVLAHEVVHVLNRHSYLSFRSYRKKMVAINILQAVGRGAQGAGGAWGWTLGTIGSIVPSVLAATISGYSRELEKEADLYAVNKLLEGGYDAGEMVSVFKLLQREQDVNLETIFYSDHPKLEERVGYVNAAIQAKAMPAKSPSGSLGERRNFFVPATENVSRQDVSLAISANRPRTALAHAQKLVNNSPDSSENFYLLAETYRALGPRTAEPTSEELSSKGKKEARKLVANFTPEEQEKKLLSKPAGQAAWQENQRKAEESYKKALELDSTNAKAHRGLGFLFEEARKDAEAVAEYRRYLEQFPDAPDRERIQRRIDSVEKTLRPSSEKPR
ncbi:MAG: M48 family metalloprotease [Acidobacteria bacterium]|nr:M48 family metalloprotease [Acidobacteriota bacterium]